MACCSSLSCTSAAMASAGAGGCTRVPTEPSEAAARRIPSIIDIGSEADAGAGDRTGGGVEAAGVWASLAHGAATVGDAAWGEYVFFIFIRIPDQHSHDHSLDARYGSSS